MLINNEHIIDILNEYNIEMIKEIKVINATINNNQDKFIILLDKKYVLKLVSTTICSSYKVDSLQELGRKYRTIGVFIPQIFKTKNGTNYIITNIDHTAFIGYLEEYSSFQTLEQYNKYISDYNTLKMVLPHIGVLSSKFSNHELLEWNTKYSIGEYCFDNRFDIPKENFMILISQLKSKINEEDLNAIVLAYNKTRNYIINNSHDLPQCVYQGDLNKSNILIDKSGKFVGLIDLDMSGTEVNVNYFLNECLLPINEYDLVNLSTNELVMKILNMQKQLLKLIEDNYQLNSLEKNILPYFDKIILCSNEKIIKDFIFYIEKDMYIDKIYNYLKLCLK